MMRLRLACVLGVTAMLAVGVACSSASTTLEKDPKAAGDDDDTTPTPTPNGKDAAPAATTTATTTATTPPPDPPKPKSKMTFFVTSTPAATDGSGNIGGLAGADKKCQDLATAVQGGDHKWAAYLAVKATGAKDRIGKGPWTNQKGVVVSTDLEALHTLDKGPLAEVLIDEKGEPVPKEGRFILTGTKLDGSPTGNNCNDWASADKNANTSFGDANPASNQVLGSGWNFARQNAINNNNSNCTTAGLTGAKSQGRVFCFATD